MQALIRKNYLATAVAHRLAKHPDSILKQGIPKTYAFEIAHADELDELFYDELYDVAQSLEDEGSDRWWILKPAMADRGQGIRLFNSKEALQAILDSFDDEDSDDEDEEDKEGQSSTKVSLNSMRDWVIQVRQQPEGGAHASSDCIVPGIRLEAFAFRYEAIAGSRITRQRPKIPLASLCAGSRIP